MALDSAPPSPPRNPELLSALPGSKVTEKKSRLKTQSRSNKTFHPLKLPCLLQRHRQELHLPRTSAPHPHLQAGEVGGGGRHPLFGTQATAGS